MRRPNLLLSLTARTRGLTLSWPFVRMRLGKGSSEAAIGAFAHHEIAPYPLGFRHHPH